jgi:transcriptional regulator with XRE-family HTH domain
MSKLSRTAAEKLEFIKKMRQLMAQKGMTQSDLARASGLGRDMISHYMRGVRYPGVGSLAKLARALGVKPGELDPEIGIPEVEDEQFWSEIKQRKDDPLHVLLRVQRVATMKQALAVMAILHGSEDDKDQS